MVVSDKKEYKMAKINVKDVEVTVIQISNEDYICITDMIKAKDGEFFVSDWLRNRNTLEYIGIWEQIYNPCFNYGEFAAINELICLSNMENLNAVFINEGLSQKERLIKLNNIAIQQMCVLQEVEGRKWLK